MPQTFQKRSNTTSKIIIIAIFIAGVGIFWVMGYLARSSRATSVGVEIQQPIAFSHRLHAGELKMDCRYCHTSVETSSFAGLPSTQTCMNCHSLILNEDPKLELVRKSWDSGEPIAWKRVNNLPDFVYFDHSIHVAKGVSCISCHGHVDRMDVIAKTESFQMSWCLDCHREPEMAIRPRSEVFNMAWVAPENQRDLGSKLVRMQHIQSKTDCSVCHR